MNLVPPSIESPLVVCERRPVWAAAIVRIWREQQTETLPLIETRHLEELAAAVAAQPAAFVLIAAEGRNAARLPMLIESLVEAHPPVVIAVAAPRAWREWAPLWRAAGACHILFSPRQLGPLVRMIARQRARFAQPLPGWAAAGVRLPDWAAAARVP